MKASLYLIVFMFLAFSFGSCTLPESRVIEHPPYLLENGETHKSPLDLDPTKFVQLEDRVPNLGLAKRPVWVRIELPANGEPLAFDVQSPNIDTVQFFRVSEGVIIAEHLTGEGFPFETRPIASPNFVFPLSPSDASSELYLRLTSGKQMLLPVVIDQPQVVQERQNRKDIFFGVYAGIVLVMFFYNFFIWFSVRDRNYLYYVLFILFVGLTQLTLNGYGNQYFWPDWPWLALRSSHFTGVLSGVTTVVFAQSYLRIPKYSRWINRLLIFYYGVYVLAFILALAGQFHASYNAINFCAAASLLLVIAAWRSYRKGYRQALFFLIAFSIFLLGVTIFVLRDLGVLPYNLLTQYALPVGSALEIVLLSFALADNINQLKREKEREQEAKLAALKENERIITEQNVILEAKVTERTKELAKSNTELNSALNELRAAQAQLVDAEKMASLGQMTAGIAHELNNPINFVSSNVVPLQRDLDEVFEIVDKYGSIEQADPDLQSKLEEAKTLAKSYDIDFLKTEITQLLSGIGDGAKRTAEIVKGLRIFSRLDEDSLKRADVNECVRSTLVILKSAIKSESKVYDALDPELPEINCYPGKLNQVFMNILVNALQATAATDKPYDQRRVEIKTSFDDDYVYVSIKDNGTGMPPEVKAKIFDPFFTTKEVGQGTGLGLSIVLGIINDHQGKIEVNTSKGEGTEFLLTLSRTL